jgi:hypothetical protein
MKVNDNIVVRNLAGEEVDAYFVKEEDDRIFYSFTKKAKGVHRGIYSCYKKDLING